ncbi:2OG-Fe(II) oxygenase [Hydrogenophaga sp. BPS33]|uniref:2OG-Fe(II) oxygenase n=1 Tax=Hydrogenophaga sp. BPS33 TaxID=2651974 RepID=UPI00131F741A|nr:2OG-Fe(II) oxygenase [Hydrogenophaga sp. BPS33]QHE87645.1 2-oxoglutarate-dependent dioxygenase [Hydrogenophaga sp. BPS33]
MSQKITPELRRWIIEQASAGFQPEAVLASMVASGWNEAVAVNAMESTLREHLRDNPAAMAQAQAVAQAQTQDPSVGVPVPDFALSESPRQLDAGDRMVDVVVTLNNPRVVVLGNLLSVEECEALIESARPRLARSLTVQTKTGGEEENEDRTSSGMFFARGETPEVALVEARIARLLNWPLENGEGFQVLNYKPGAEYKPHYDYFDPSEPGTPTILRRGGQRVATLVMYLNEPTRGGGTTFPDVGLEVAPVRGNAVFFSYDRPYPSTRTLHGGAPVIEGEKWIATKWLREREFV